MRVVPYCIASKTSQLGSVLKQEEDGEQLIQMGTSFNNSMLKLIGHAFVNLEETAVHELCHKNPCTLWSNWTDCTANGTNAFGFQTRVRKCWYNSTDACAQDGTVTIETASKVCEGGHVNEPCNKIPQCSLWSNLTDCKSNGTSAFTFQTRVRNCWYNRTRVCVQDGLVTKETVSKVCKRWCREDYSVSKHGFCLKVHTTIRNQADAERVCQSEGGHLMNPDTKERGIDRENMLKVYKNRFFWVDGVRRKVPGPYSFVEGSSPITNGLVTWRRGEPSNNRNEFCIMEQSHNGQIIWWDAICSHLMRSVCEIRMT